MSGIAAVLGISGAPGVINGALPNSSAISPSNYVIGNGGTYSINGGGASGDWVSPSSALIAAYYQVQVDPTSGTFDGGSAATGSYLDCSSTRTWTKSAGVVTFTISFREKATGVVRSVQAGVTLTGS